MKRKFLIGMVAVLLAVMGAAQAGGDAAAGKIKASGCAGCHGANGEGVKPNPALAGKPADEFVQAMKDYKSGKRNNPMMKALAAPLSDQDLANLGAHYASLKAK